MSFKWLYIHSKNVFIDMKRIHNMYFISQFFSACVCMCIQRIRLPMQETWVQSSPGKILGEGDGSPFQYSCLEKSHGQRSLAVYSPWGCKESDTTEQLTLYNLISYMVPYNLWKLWKTSIEICTYEILVYWL